MTDEAPEKRKASGSRKPPIPGAPKSVHNSTTSPKAIARLQRIAEALEFRLQGHSFPQIAQAMNVSTSTAFDLVCAGLAAIIREPAEQVRKMELERLDMLQATYFSAACQGDINAFNCVMRVMERRSKLEGFDKQPEAPAFAALAGAVPHLTVTFVNSDDDPPVIDGSYRRPDGETKH